MNRREEVQKEYENIRQWTIDEEKKVTEKLRQDGKLKIGLDTEHAEFEYIYKERDRRIVELKKQYSDLFNK